MVDTLTPAERSARMRLIKAKNTKPELLVRRLVWGLGYRYRLHRSDLPGTPDMAFIGRRKVIFVHGCFWHLHRECPNNRPPKSRRAFWDAKLASNRDRDARNGERLRDMGWRHLVVWECETTHVKELGNRLVCFLEDQ